MRTFRTGGLRSLGNQMSIPIKTDKDGYLGRECPNTECEEYFKITPGTGIKGPAPCHCPYCGLEGDPQTFWTKQQIEYAKSVAMSRLVGALRQDLKAMEFDHKPRGAFGIGISMKLKPSAPVPIPLSTFQEHHRSLMSPRLLCPAWILDRAHMVQRTCRLSI